LNHELDTNLRRVRGGETKMDELQFENVLKVYAMSLPEFPKYPGEPR
jgi:hypothetical protein